MISYAFDQPLVPLIQSGLVWSTFRPPSLRHARPGEIIRLTDRKTFRPIIPDVLCTYVDHCEISWQDDHISGIRQGGVPVIWTDRFANSLGFADMAELERSLAADFGLTFTEGFIIEWNPPTSALAEVAA